MRLLLRIWSIALRVALRVALRIALRIDLRTDLRTSLICLRLASRIRDSAPSCPEALGGEGPANVSERPWSWHAGMMSRGFNREGIEALKWLSGT